MLAKPEYAEDEATIPEAEPEEFSEEELARYSALLAEALTLPAPPLLVVGA